MVEFTEAAREKITEIIEAKAQEDMMLRMQIMGRGPGGFLYSLRFVPADEKSPDDIELNMESFHVLIDQNSAQNLEGSTVDYKDDNFQRGFSVDNPNPLWEDPTAQSIQDVLDSKVNPGISSHGGFVSLVEYKEDTAYIAFGGGCQGCGLVDVTLKQGVEVMIRESVSEVQNIVDLTDHASGDQPFYEAKSGESALG
ncbi:MAG: iron-sulfur cluster assembly accessory protein [Anaerolineales bacterium]